MKNFDWKEFRKGNLVVHCDTYEKYMDFLHKCKKNNIYCPLVFEKKESFCVYENNTCFRYNTTMLAYGSYNYYQCHGYLIVDWETDDNNTKFTKSDLKVGMVVKLRDGRVGIVMKDFIMFKNNYLGLYSLSDDLTSIGLFNELDIVEVYEFESANCFEDIDNTDSLHLIWERENEEIIEMTISEICEALGKNIRIKED